MDIRTITLIPVISAVALLTTSGVPAPAGSSPLVGPDGGVGCSTVLVVDETDAPDGFLADVRTVGAELADLTGVQVTVTTVPPVEVSGVTVVTMQWGPMPEGRHAFGIASRPVMTGPVPEARVLFTPEGRGLADVGRLNLVRHELGHVFGLPHADEGAVSTMSESLSRLNILVTRGVDPWTEDVRDALTGLYAGACPA